VKRSDRGKPYVFACDWHLLDPEQIALRADTSIGREARRAKFGRSRGVIEMRVGDEDLLQRQPVVLHHRQHPLEIAARIDHRGAPRLLTPDRRNSFAGTT
jgi:hypothetical protein